MSERVFSLSFGGGAGMAARYFWDDSLTEEHADATEADCAEQVRLYIESHGLADFLRDWNLEDDVKIHVGGEKAWP